MSLAMTNGKSEPQRQRCARETDGDRGVAPVGGAPNAAGGGGGDERTAGGDGRRSRAPTTTRAGTAATVGGGRRARASESESAEVRARE